MPSSHLWAPSLEPRTIINSWAYKHAIINECISISKEESEYEAQVCVYLRYFVNECEKYNLFGSLIHSFLLYT